MEAIDFVILDSDVLKQLQAATLSFLTLLFDFKQVVRAALIACSELFPLSVLLFDEVLQLADFLGPVFSC